MERSQIEEAGRLTRAAIRERNLAGAGESIARDADAIRDAALLLRQYVFDGEHGDSAPDMWIVRIAEAIREAAVAEMDARNDEAEFDRQADMTGNDGCQGHPAGEFDPMGETVFCDGSCQEVIR